jgi:putative DNA primase/helicase
VSVAQLAERWAKPGSDTSEDELSQRFVTANPHWRYVAEWGQWQRWDGQRWQPDKTLALFEAVRRFLRQQDGSSKLGAAATVAAVERLTRCDRRVAATADQWDADPWKLNTPAGVLDLETGSLADPDPEQYHRKVAAVAPTGECPRWESFLLEVMGGDAEMVSYLQRVAGYCLTGSTREHAFFFCYGTGRNGKGVFLNTLSGVLGDYATVADMNTFTEANGERHPTELAMLQGARLVIAQETEEGRRWAESRIKALTGGDKISARYMRQDFFQFTPAFKLLIAGNHRPRLSVVDEAMRARLNIIPFTVTIPAERRDPQLADKLREEWPGILNWALVGCLRYQAEGLQPPASVQAATDDYFGAQDVLGDWLADCCEVGAEHWEVPTRLFKSWTTYAEAAKERPGRRGDFNDRLKARGFRDGRDGTRGRYWAGLKLKETVESRPW